MRTDISATSFSFFSCFMSWSHWIFRGNNLGTSEAHHTTAEAQQEEAFFLWVNKSSSCRKPARKRERCMLAETAKKARESGEQNPFQTQGYNSTAALWIAVFQLAGAVRRQFFTVPNKAHLQQGCSMCCDKKNQKKPAQPIETQQPAGPGSGGRDKIDAALILSMSEMHNRTQPASCHKCDKHGGFTRICLCMYKQVNEKSTALKDIC